MEATTTTTTTETAAPVQTTEATATTETTENKGQTTEQTETKTEPQLKKFKLKVDGEEFEETLDLSNEAELVKRLQLAKAAEKRITQAKTEKQKAMEIAKAFEDGTLFKKHPKARELAEQFLLEQLEAEMLTPEQKRLKELESYKAKKDSEEREAKELQAKAAQEAKEREIATNFQKTIIDALDKSGLPKTPEMAKRMAYIMKKNLDLGLNLTSEDLVQEVKSETLAMIKSVIASAQDGDQIISLFGEDVAKKIRAADVKKLKEKMNMPQGKSQPVDVPKNPKTDKPMSIDEWKEMIAKRVQG